MVSILRLTFGLRLTTVEERVRETRFRTHRESVVERENRLRKEREALANKLSESGRTSPDARHYLPPMFVNKSNIMSPSSDVLMNRPTEEELMARRAKERSMPR